LLLNICVIDIGGSTNPVPQMSIEKPSLVNLAHTLQFFEEVKGKVRSESNFEIAKQTKVFSSLLEQFFKIGF